MLEYLKIWLADFFRKGKVTLLWDCSQLKN